MDYAVKFVDGHDDLIEGMLAPFGGPIAGKDLDGEFFSSETDFSLEWFGDWQRPLLFGHGFDPTLKTSVVGRIKVEPTEKGVWMQAQLDKKHAYYEQIAALLGEGLGLSSGAVDHLTDIDTKSGHIKRWPLIEGSLTPTPANPDATAKYAMKSADVADHLAVLGIEMPPGLVVVDDQPSQSVVPIPEEPNVEPATKADYTDIIEAVKSAFTPQSLHDAAIASGAKCASEPEPDPPAPLLAIAGKSAEPVTPDDLEALRAEMTAQAIKEAQALLG